MNQSIIATLIAFVTVVVLCPFMIPYLEKLKFGQAERELGPKSHYKKAGTPTMGGVVMIAAICIACAFFLGSGDSSLLIAIVITVIFGLIGFMDDYIKIVQKNAIQSERGVSTASLGMWARHKLILQFSLSAALALYAMFHPLIGTSIVIPFSEKLLDLGAFYIPFVMVVIVAVVNAVNLTDGLDGLASGVTLIVMMFFLMSALSSGYNAMGTLSAAVIGACLGFLCYNFNPAKVFMGDTGSMALGGAVAAVSVLTRTELFLLLAGAIFAIEMLSVALQIGYFKLSHGKRLFKMAPIHHHFELTGWSETRIVIVFWAFSAFCVLISMLSLHVQL